MDQIPDFHRFFHRLAGHVWPLASEPPRQWLHGANVKLGLNPQGTLFSTDRPGKKWIFASKGYGVRV